MAPNVITITATQRAMVISEAIVDDGRERHENGRDLLEPGKPRSFIVDSGASVRVIDAPVAPEDEAVAAANAHASAKADAEASAKADAEASTEQIAAEVA